MRLAPRLIRYVSTLRFTVPPRLKASARRSCRTDGFSRSWTAFAEAPLASMSRRMKLTSEPVSEACAAKDSCR